MSKLHWFILLFGWITGMIGAFFNLYIPRKERDEAKYNFKSEITEAHRFSISLYLYWPFGIAVITALYYFLVHFEYVVLRLGGSLIDTVMVLLVIFLIFVMYIAFTMISMIIAEMAKSLLLISYYEKINVKINDEVYPDE